MLFTYRFVPHRMDKMQTFLDYVFFNVWCKAPGKEYDITVFDGNPELKEIIEELHYSESKYGDLFVSTIETVFAIFKRLTPPQIRTLKQWYQANNDIKKLCEMDRETRPVTYTGLESSSIKDLV